MRLERHEQGRENPLVRSDDRIARIGDIENRISIVRVDRDLHRIADIVEATTLGFLRVRQSAADGVRILQPDKPAAVHDQVGIVIEL